jgi:hypothetical protein
MLKTPEEMRAANRARRRSWWISEPDKIAPYAPKKKKPEYNRSALLRKATPDMAAHEHEMISVIYAAAVRVSDLTSLNK